MLKTYCFDINPAHTPFVVSTLLSSGGNNDSVIVELIDAINNDEQVIELIQVAEENGRLKILQDFLESKAKNGCTLPEIHTALAKIYILTNNDAMQFLKSNKYYDAIQIGLFAESRDPRLAFEAFKKVSVTPI
ncbi:hypothetical protein GEMRC1_007557 [Eukaryota sp. GEM-RC1]